MARFTNVHPAVRGVLPSGRPRLGAVDVDDYVLRAGVVEATSAASVDQAAPRVLLAAPRGLALDVEGPLPSLRDIIATAVQYLGRLRTKSGQGK